MIRYCMYILFVWLAGLSIAPASAIAQQPAAENSVSYARYATPGECASTLLRLEQQYWRARRPDTIYHGPLGQPVVPLAIAGAQRCLAKFQVESVAFHDLLGFGQALLAVEQFDRADTVFRRWLAEADTLPVEEQGWIGFRIAESYLAISPRRIQDARRYARMLDSLGRAAAAPRMLAHLAIAGAARKADSTTLVEEEILAAVSASREMEGVRKKERAMDAARVFQTLAYVRMRNGDIAGAKAVLDSAIDELTPIRPRAAGAVRSTRRIYELLGKPAAPLQATRWVNKKDTLFPSNKPTVITFVRHNCNPSMCYPGYSVARRLAQSEHGKQANVVFVARTEGYVSNWQLAPADEEMDHITTFYGDHLALPIILAIWHTPFGRQKDGALEVLRDPNANAYPQQISYSMATFIVDAHGVVRYVTSMSPSNEVEINNMVRSLQ